MKFSAIYLFVLVTMLSFSGCGNDKEEPERFSSLSTDVKKILKSDNGILRGFNFGENTEDVVAIEGHSEGGTEGSYLFYQIPLGTPEEKAEVYYYFDKESMLVGFGVDIFLKESGRSDQFLNELVAYYKAKFGKPEKTTDNETKWSLMGGQKYLSVLFFNEDDFGIQIDIK